MACARKEKWKVHMTPYKYCRQCGMDLVVGFREGFWQKIEKLEVNIGRRSIPERRNTCAKAIVAGAIGTRKNAKTGELDKYKRGSDVTLNDFKNWARWFLSLSSICNLHVIFSMSSMSIKSAYSLLLSFILQLHLFQASRETMKVPWLYSTLCSVRFSWFVKENEISGELKEKWAIFIVVVIKAFLCGFTLLSIMYNKIFNTVSWIQIRLFLLSAKHCWILIGWVPSNAGHSVPEANEVNFPFIPLCVACISH